MKRILLVEDEPDLIKILDVVLSEERYQVTQMRNAEDTLLFCQVSTPDLIVSDIKMGTMDGLTMLEPEENPVRLHQCSERCRVGRQGKGTWRRGIFRQTVRH